MSLDELEVRLAHRLGLRCAGRVGALTAHSDGRLHLAGRAGELTVMTGGWTIVVRPYGAGLFAVDAAGDLDRRALAVERLARLVPWRGAGQPAAAAVGTVPMSAPASSAATSAA